MCAATARISPGLWVLGIWTFDAADQLAPVAVILKLTVYTDRDNPSDSCYREIEIPAPAIDLHPDCYLFQLPGAPAGDSQSGYPV